MFYSSVVQYQNIFYKEPKGVTMSTEQKLKKIIMDQLGVSENEVRPDAAFIDDLGADSLDLTELIMAMEETFNIEIGDEDSAKIIKVQDAVDYVNAHLSN